jgi:hypothetical protein
MTTTIANQNPIRVFISYTQESQEHNDLAVGIANRLRKIGFQSDIDQYHYNEKWPLWMEKSIQESDFVLVICTETYRNRWDANEEEGKGLGAQWEGNLVRNELYQSPRRNDKFIPVVFDETYRKFIPIPLADVTRIDIGTKLEYFEKLQKRLLGQAPVQMPPIGTSHASIVEANKFPNQNEKFGISETPEYVTTNMFPIAFPEYIFCAKISPRYRGQLPSQIGNIFKMSKTENKVPLDYVVENNSFYTFRNLNAPDWEKLFTLGVLTQRTQIPSLTWAESSVQGDISKFIKLLRRNLAHLCNNTATKYPIKYSEKMKCYLFSTTNGDREGQIRTRAIKVLATRTIFKAILDKKEEGKEKIQHWKHCEAFRDKFQRFGEEWYLILEPFFAFTSDGVSVPSQWQKRSSANMKKLEKNRAVLGHVIFWASILCMKDDMFASQECFKIRQPENLAISPSITDALWMETEDAEEQAKIKNDLQVEIEEVLHD